MTRFTAVFSAATVAAVLCVAPRAHATLTWVQQPGLANDIAVAANDMPWVVDINGYVQYGTPGNACAPNTLCPQDPTDVQWHMLTPGSSGYKMAHIGVTLDNLLVATNPAGDMTLVQVPYSTVLTCKNWMLWRLSGLGFASHLYAQQHYRS